MSPVRIIIVDDEKRIRISLINVLKIHYPNAIVVAEADDVKSAIEAIKTHQPDIVLLDIKLPDGTGFDIFTHLSPQSFNVIFITAFDQYAVQAFKFCALDYLLKPVVPQELVDALMRAEQKIFQDNIAEKLKVFLNNTNTNSIDTKKIVINCKDKIEVVGVTQIIRCEADGNYTKFFLIKGKTILVSRQLKEFEEMLSSYGFFRSHHSHLINLMHVERLEKRDGRILVMKDGSCVLVSSRKYTDLIAVLNNI